MVRSQHVTFVAGGTLITLKCKEEILFNGYFQSFRYSLKGGRILTSMGVSRIYFGLGQILGCKVFNCCHGAIDGGESKSGSANIFNCLMKFNFLQVNLTNFIAIHC